MAQDTPDRFPDEETGKDRAARVRLDYHRHHDGVARAKSLLTWAALVASVAWVLFGLRFGGVGFGHDRRTGADRAAPVALTETGRQRVNHGPVAAVHAAWESDCDACHEPFVPINPNSVAAGWVGDHVGSVTRKCSACHAGPRHHPNQRASANLSCTACHRDHRGRDHDLAAVTDAACTACHADLARFRMGTRPDDADRPDGWDRVTAFALASAAAARREADDPPPHPPFRVDTPDGAGDPGRLKFNHAVHLAPGLKGGGVDFYRYADIPDTDATARYLAQSPGGAASAGDLVELDCTACHATAVTGADGEVELAGDRRYFLPIDYRRHCRACHPVDLPGFAAPGLPEESADRPIDVPHGLSVRATDTAVREAIAGRLLEAGLPNLADAELDRLTGGDGAGGGDGADGGAEGGDGGLSAAAAAIFARSAGVFPPRKEGAVRRELRESPEAAAALREELAAKLPDRLFGAAANRQMLFGEEQTCAKCHFFTTADPATGEITLAADEKGREYAPDADDLTGPAFASLHIAPPDVPDVWYERGVFDHRPHRATACATCHPAGANPRAAAAVGYDPVLGVRQGGWAAFTAAEMLIPGVENCRACHAPESTDPATGLHTGGVRFGCTVCHLYHAADMHAGGIRKDRWQNHAPRFESAEEFLNLSDGPAGRPETRDQRLERNDGPGGDLTGVGRAEPDARAGTPTTRSADVGHGTAHPSPLASGLSSLVSPVPARAPHTPGVQP